MRRGGGIALLLMLLVAPAAAQGPSADWRTIQTAHFRIHFSAPFQPWAEHVAASIEGIEASVTAFIGYTPGSRIEVVLSDPAADVNGIAIPYLDRPEIILWATQPDADFDLGDFSDWARLLATHELAHIVHLSRPREGLLGILARLSPAPFGPLALRSPRWVIEGYATLVEGALTGSGRPASSFRAMVLRQFAIEKKLPLFGALSGKGGWLGGSVAYLVGSAYLEWLSQREGKNSLPRLWERMASRHGCGFSASFRDIFGQSPRQLYERFTAEITEHALEEQARLTAAGLVEGELWQSLDGGASAAQVSPDGSRVLVRRDPERGKSFLAVWEIAGAQGAAQRKPRWTLPRRDGFAAADPRWMPGGKDVLLARRSPDAEGVLRWDLYRWTVEGGGVRRLTHAADVADADPSPDGRWAVAVRRRFGATTLVRVDLETGGVREIPARLDAGDAWPVWSHPRVSPDGRHVVALLHGNGRWRLVTLPAEGGSVRDLGLPGAPATAPAWSSDGSRVFVTTDVTGIWNVAELDPASGRFEERTRVTGGAFSPAATPDGKGLFFLELTAKGVDLRRLELWSPAPQPLEAAEDARFVLPPRTSATVAPPPVSAIPPERAYSIWDSQTIRSLVNFGFGPDGSAVQIGLDGADVVGRLHWLAAASVGDAAGPRGGTALAAYRGLPVEISLQLFSAIEKPGNQSLVARPAFDQERRGGYLGATWSRVLPAGRVSVEAGGGATHVTALSDGSHFERALGSVRGELALRRTRGRSGLSVGLEASGSFGSTGGASWGQVAGGARLTAIAPFASLSVAGRAGDTGGSPSRFDLFAIGGAPSTILPPGLDRNRIESGALPADVQVGERFESWRVELAGAAVPLVLYGEWLRAWNAGQSRPEPVRVVGAELRLERLIPIEFDRSVSFHVGIAQVQSETPRFRSTRGYAWLIYRP